MTDKIRDMFDIAWEQKYQNPSHAIFDKHDFFLMYQAGYQAANAEARELVEELNNALKLHHMRYGSHPLFNAEQDAQDA